MRGHDKFSEKEKLHLLSLQTEDELETMRNKDVSGLEEMVERQAAVDHLMTTYDSFNEDQRIIYDTLNWGKHRETGILEIELRKKEEQLKLYQWCSITLAIMLVSAMAMNLLWTIAIAWKSRHLESTFI